MKIEVVRGNDAFSLLECAEFLSEWSRLCEQCPWATAFQGSGFCTAWYRTYSERFEPLLVMSHDESGRLNGLLPLGVSPGDGRLVVAGDWQAEYHCWISAPNIADSFPWQAAQSFQRRFPRAVLTFQYLPPKAPLSWLTYPEASRTCKLERHRRPLLCFGDGTEIAASLKKKSNKSRLSRLEKMGPANFAQVTDSTEFERVLDEMIPWVDFRQAALHGNAPFLDALKRAFYLAIFDVPGLMHVTTLRFGRHLVAAHIGARSHREVQLGIIAHSPFLSRHSPGKFHILFLAQMLMREGYEQLDLTSGGDSYKDRFANAEDEVHTLTVYPSRTQRRKADLLAGVKARAGAMLKKVRVSPSRLKTLAAKLARAHFRGTAMRFFRNTRAWIACRRELRLYSFDASRANEIEAAGPVRRDSLEDLLLYQPAESWLPREKLLSEALRQIEDGNHVYSCAEDGRLLHFGWLIERQTKSFAAEVHQEHHFPPDSAVLFGFYTVPSARGRGLYARSLCTILRDAAAIPGTKKVYISVLADNTPSRHVIEKVGFTYEGSLFEEVRFGAARQWKTIL